MSLRRVLLGFATALLALAAIAGAGLAWFKHAPRRTPAGQPALSRLNASTFPAFRDAFNADASATRLVVLLSPT